MSETLATSRVRPVEGRPWPAEKWGWPADGHGMWLAPMPIDALRCPLCGTSVKWNCPTAQGSGGHADCEAGRRVTRRVVGPEVPPCSWAGASTYRHAGEVWVEEPWPRGDDEGGTR